MILDALDSVVEATRAGRITWEELDSGRFETATAQKFQLSLIILRLEARLRWGQTSQLLHSAG